MWQRPLSLTIQQQHCPEWCRAATTLAVCGCYGDARPATQEDLADLVLGLPAGTPCECRTNPAAACNQPRNLASVLTTVNDHGQDDPNGLPDLAFADLKGEIDAGRPVVVDVRFDAAGGAGHALVIYGYSDDGTVLVADPMNAGDRITVNFADFVAGRATSHGSWHAAFRTKGTNN